MKPANILVGVCGGVAVYKALEVVSALRKAGHTPRVVMTEAATRFVQPAAFAAVSGQPVFSDMWTGVEQGGRESYPHLYPATEADLFLLLPATANTLAKIAGGFGMDLLSTCCLSLPAHCRKIFCPSMNVEMWRNPRVQENVRQLESAGWTRLGPASGHLACGMQGEGRMSEPAEILAAVMDALQPVRPWKGKRLLILSGPTHEHLDPVRYLGNPSSGLMGRALAEAAARLGAEVDFISGPVPEANLPAAPGIHLQRVTSALEMLAAARTALPQAQAMIYAAAVADYRPETTLDHKPAKQPEGFDLRLLPNPDLAATLNAEKADGVFAIGFALQTQDGEAEARRKLAAKQLDGIVLNYADSLGASAGNFSYLARGAKGFEAWGQIDKTEAARRILQKIPFPSPDAAHG